VLAHAPGRPLPLARTRPAAEPAATPMKSRRLIGRSAGRGEGSFGHSSRESPSWPISALGRTLPLCVLGKPLIVPDGLRAAEAGEEAETRLDHPRMAPRELAFAYQGRVTMPWANSTPTTKTAKPPARSVQSSVNFLAFLANERTTAGTMNISKPSDSSSDLLADRHGDQSSQCAPHYQGHNGLVEYVTTTAGEVVRLVAAGKSVPMTVRAPGSRWLPRRRYLSRCPRSRPVGPRSRRRRGLTHV
jgi:hypothetical protein